MNIQIKKKNLFSYKIQDYYTSDKEDFKPYLWTSAFGLLHMLKFENKLNVEKYIDQVHNSLGMHTNGKMRLSDIIELKWIENLSEEEKDLINKLCEDKDSLLGSLRIGKFEQYQDSSFKEEPGIYLHYCTKWAYALIKTSQVSKNKIYLYQSANMMLSMCEKSVNLSDDSNINYHRKMNQTLNEPEQSGEILHDPLDVFITLLDLIYNFIKYEKNKKVKEIYIKLLLKKLIVNIKRIEEYNINPKLLKTSDQLGIGFLLVSSFKLRHLINKFRSILKGNQLLDTFFRHYNYIKFMKLLKKLYLNCLVLATNNFQEYSQFTKDVIHSDAYRWLGIAIGLKAIRNLDLNNKKTLKKMEGKKKNSKIKKNIDLTARPFIEKIMNNYETRKHIHNNFNKESYMKSNWKEHLDINIVTYLYSKNPTFNF